MTNLITSLSDLSLLGIYSLEDRAVDMSVCFFRGWCPTLKQKIEKEQSSCSDVLSLDHILVIVDGL